MPAPRPPKIAIIGAGSSSFGPNTLATLLRTPALRGAGLALVDLDEVSVQRVARVARRMNESWDAGMRISATTDRREALPGADYVIISIEVPPREALWRQDWEVTRKHGLRQPYGENGGPGGLMHALRQIPPFLDIARDMEALCPHAWLINYSNPLPRITRAVTKATAVKIVGKCHQLKVGYAMAGMLLADRYGLAVPDGVHFASDPTNSIRTDEVAAVMRRHVRITAAGLNHFTWILGIHDRATGENLYPALRAALAAGPPPAMEPLSMDLFRALGYCPAPGDNHLAEYLPYGHDPLAKPWERYNIRLYDWEANEQMRTFGHHMLEQMAMGKLDLEAMRAVHSEGAAELITALHGGEPFLDEAVNIPNGGAISNLPPEAIVELPAVVDANGISGRLLGPLPPTIAELCRRESALVELVVDAALSGDRQLALEALLLDPMIGDIQRARDILDDYLRTFADQLPQFD